MAVKKRARKKARKKKAGPAKKKAQRKPKKKSHKARLKKRPLRGRFRKLRELREGVECTFSIENQRAERVTISCVDSRTGRPVRVKSVEPDERVPQDSFEGQKWVAKVGPRSVAAYQATPRVPVWTLLDAENDFVPPLPIGDNGDLNEAIPTAKVYQQATGEVKAVMVFVEFPDVRHDRSVEEACSIISRDAKDWYRIESYGRLRFEVTLHGDWQMMPKRTTAYSDIQSDANAHREYISTALSLFATGSINYNDYDIAYVVAAKTPEVPGVLFNSPTLSAGIEVPTNNGTVWHAVTFGRDSYERGYHVLLHETGHLFGLPDLYLFNSTDWLEPVGAWDIMCDLDLGQHFLGWHKYKFGWLDESQLFYLKSGEVSLPLAPFESAEGVKMILLPSESKSRLYVVEIAQALGANQEYRDKGILVYTVDAAVETGKRPVSVVSGLDESPSANETKKYGALCVAYLAPGETQTFGLSDGRKIEITNEKQSGSGFQVRARQFAATRTMRSVRRTRNPGKDRSVVLGSHAAPNAPVCAASAFFPLTDNLGQLTRSNGRSLSTQAD
jgi:M6 family metalloprotease-like protein